MEFFSSSRIFQQPEFIFLEIELTSVFSTLEICPFSDSIIQLVFLSRSYLAVVENLGYLMLELILFFRLRLHLARI